MTSLLKLTRNLTLLTALSAVSAFAAPTLVEFTSEASRPAPNDLVRATVAAEASGATPGELARQVNSQISDALRSAKNYSSVKAQSANTSTFPVYSKNGKIESWRMRSEFSLESGDTAALSELLGKLQGTLGVSNIQMQPSPETRKKIENEVMIDAITAFKARAKIISESFGKPYRIKQISVNTSGRFAQPMYRAAAKSMMAEAAPMPVEAGESTITATVSGQIELE